MKKNLVIFISVVFVAISFAAKINLSSEVGIHTDAWKTQMSPFTEETGVDVSIEQFPYSNYLNQLMLGYTSGRNEFDVPYISLLWYPSLALANYICPISDIKGYEDLNESDIPGIENSKMNGKTYVIPYMNELGGILYRKDLFEDPVEQKNFKERYGYDLTPPKTMKQYEDIAEFFNRPPELYGVSLMGKRSIFLATHFMQRLWANGGQLLDDDFYPVFNSEAGLKALEDVKAMFEFANPAAKNYDFQEAVNEFVTGRSAMAEVWTTAMFYVADPERSSIVGKASFVGFPRPEDKVDEVLPMLYISWGFVISQDAEDKEAALEWLKFVTAPEREAAAAPIGNIPARLSAMKDAELIKTFPWITAFREAISTCIPTPIVPLIPEGSSIVNSSIAPAVSEFLAGSKTAKQALDDAAKQVRDMMEENGYY
ncbi:MAG TPA: extracellular solute-binding protein [Thermotogota bacterium]|nr:extracellular solute-binding protein [Thermotogota bacterium]HPJ90007.1 extracellular solute-binding protein [Thermotogota bacterium]HPR97053.1 extracellular solute-binding protein [Thermotogota bacterium]